MALTINGSIASINAQRQLTKNTTALTQTFQRLSSGLRVNTAKDDAAGLAIVTRMTAQIRGMNTASRNANDGISLVQVAEGALSETSSALQRMRELAVQSANATNSDQDRLSLQTELAQLLSEVDRISKASQFNGKALFGGSTDGINLAPATSHFAGYFQVGPNAGQTVLVSIQRTTVSMLGLSTAATTNFGISTLAKAQSTISVIDNALNSVSSIRANLGAMQTRFESIVANLANVVENTDAARSRIQDADIALETSNLTKNSILQQAGVAILAQANQQPSIALTLLASR
ncbi:Flagellin [Candidatus Magnetaquicoccaceae bacterium FCR-1]|uniref:Flagellin n=1 Tax=Candidatus Magnetaquiglobus chichijimensis TaxID=3141448 RepID=A0ABQ0C4Z0_9PROT